MANQTNAAGLEPEFRISSILVPLVAIIFGVFMVILDSTAMNVALSKLVEDFKVQLPTLQWAVTGYMLAQAAVIPLAGWLSDRFGAKTIFLTSVILFTLGSALCATPNSAEWLIVFRVIQGLGGGFVLPVSMAYVFRLSPRDKVGRVMGMLGVPMLLAPALGPIISGWLVEYHSWRWIFLINLPVGAMAVLFGAWKLPKLPRNKVAGFDMLGMILGPLAFAAISYGVSEGAVSWTSDKTLTGLIVGGIALLAFIIVELRVKVPLLELRVLKSVDFSFGFFVQLVVQGVLFGAIFLLPQFLQQARGFTPFETGLTLFPQAIASAIMMPIGGLLFDKIGVRWLVIVGLSLISGALYQYAQIDLNTQRSDLLLPLLMAGAGMGIMMMPLSSHLMSKAPRALVSRVTSLTSAMQQVASSLSIAALVTVLTSRAMKLATDAAKSGLSQDEIKKNFFTYAVKAFDHTFSVMLVIAACSIALGIFLRRGAKHETPEKSSEPALEGMHMG